MDDFSGFDVLMAARANMRSVDVYMVDKEEEP
jgi:hypothetical protein